MIKSYQHKPTAVQAVQWDGTDECLEAVRKMDTRARWMIYRVYPGATLRVLKRDGPMDAQLSDYIVRSATGELYVVPEHMFNTSYDEAP